jgi:hypothetical protein
MMEIALIHNNSLILGPMGFNVRMINSELEDLELEDRITTQSYTNIPIHFSDELTHLLLIEKEIPGYDPNYYNLGNFNWEIIEEDNVPIKVKLTYPLVEKTIEEVKYSRKQEVTAERKQKENKIISLTINETEIKIATSREERLILASKLSASPGLHNYKFSNTWLEITTENLQYIITEIDRVVQSAYDWELSKLQEIDACQTLDEIYNVIVKEEVAIG